MNQGSNFAERDIIVHNHQAPEVKTLTSPHDFNEDRKIGTTASCFTGRTEIIEKIETILFNPCSHKRRLTVIHGLHGIGKSSIADNFAQSHKKEYSIVSKLNADSEVSLINSINRLGSCIGIPPADSRLSCDDEAHMILQRLKNYSSGKRVLLILDNVQQQNIITKWFPESTNASNMHIIATTNEKNWGTDYNPISIGPLTPIQAERYFQRAMNGGNTPRVLNKHETSELAKRLGGHPLALTHATAYLRHYFDYPVDTYLSSLSKRFEEFPTKEFPTNEPSQRSVLSSFRASIARSEEQDPGAAAVLCFASLFGSEPLPQELFTQNLEVLSKGLCPKASFFDGNPVDLYTALKNRENWYKTSSTLDRLSLIDKDREAGLITTHGLVRLAARSLLGERVTAWKQCALASIYAAIREPHDNENTLHEKSENMIPHAIFVLDSMNDEEKLSPDFHLSDLRRSSNYIMRIPLQKIEFDPMADLNNMCGNYLRKRACFDKAEEFLKCSLKINTTKYGPKSDQVAADLGNIGLLFAAAGEPIAAEQSLMESWKMNLDNHGKFHSSVTISLNNLGELFCNVNKLDKAEIMHRNSLEIRRKIFPKESKESSEIAIALTNLGTLLLKKNHYKEAEKNLDEALKILKKSGTGQSRSMALASRKLADLLHETDRYVEAEPLYRDALALEEALSGPDHPEVAILLNQLANLLQDTNRWKEAEPLYAHALAINKSNFQSSHPCVAQNLNNLAYMYVRTNRHREAEELYREALEIRKASLGEQHLDFATSLSNLGDLLRVTNRHTEAQVFLDQSFEIRKKQLKDNHPLVATSMESLASLYREQEKYPEALDMGRRALEINEKIYGLEHSSVALDLNNLALSLYKAKKYREAEDLYNRALHIDKKNLPPDHPDLATDFHNLATLMRDTNRPEQAEKMYRDAIAIWTRSFGPNHPSVAASLTHLANLLRDTNRHSEAESMYRNALKIREVSLPANHPSTRDTLENLALLLTQKNRIEEAAALLPRTHAARTDSAIALQQKFAISGSGSRRSSP